jgi:hypothetical protein
LSFFDFKEAWKEMGFSLIWETKPEHCLEEEFAEILFATALSKNEKTAKQT